MDDIVCKCSQARARALDVSRRLLEMEVHKNRARSSAEYVYDRLKAIGG